MAFSGVIIYCATIKFQKLKQVENPGICWFVVNGKSFFVIYLVKKLCHVLTFVFGRDFFLFVLKALSVKKNSITHLLQRTVQSRTEKNCLKS